MCGIQLTSLKDKRARLIMGEWEDYLQVGDCRVAAGVGGDEGGEEVGEGTGIDDLVGVDAGAGGGLWGVHLESQGDLGSLDLGFWVVRIEEDEEVEKGRLREWKDEGFGVLEEKSGSELLMGNSVNFAVIAIVILFD